MHTSKITRQSWCWVYILPISRSLRLYLHTTALARSDLSQPQTWSPPPAPGPPEPTRASRSRKEFAKPVAQLSGSTGLQLATLVAVSWPMIVGLQHMAGRATDQRAGLDEWMEMDGASLISQTGFYRGADLASRFMRRTEPVDVLVSKAARTAFTRLPRQLGEATPEELPRPLAARLVSSEASIR